MSDGWVMRTPAELSSAKAFRFRLDAQALARAEELSLLRAHRSVLLLTIKRLRSARDDSLKIVGELAATQVHPHAENCVGDGRPRRSA